MEGRGRGEWRTAKCSGDKTKGCTACIRKRGKKGEKRENESKQVEIRIGRKEKEVEVYK